MRTIVYFLLTAFSSVDQEAQFFVEESTKQINEEASTFLRSLEDGQKSPKCKNCPSPSISSLEGGSSLLVFISFSVPLESWKDWSKEIEDRGGVFVLRGLPFNSFVSFAQKVKEMRNSGVTAPITIDPEAYQKYDIMVVPSLVLRRGEDYDKVTGNIRMMDIERLFKDREGEGGR